MHAFPVEHGIIVCKKHTQKTKTLTIKFNIQKKFEGIMLSLTNHEMEVKKKFSLQLASIPSLKTK